MGVEALIQESDEFADTHWVCVVDFDSDTIVSRAKFALMGANVENLNTAYGHLVAWPAVVKADSGNFIFVP